MRTYFSLALVSMACLAITACYSFDAKSAARSKTSSADKHFVVVELFTSEGCSSCPPADELMSRLAAENNPEVYLLSFHVDYWDRLGWKDRFSSALFSRRQREYAQHLSLESVYTPEIIVNGTEEFVGSNERRLRSAITKLKLSNLGISATKHDDRTLKVSYTMESADSTLLNVALVQHEATTQVSGGENTGRKLHHVNIVRSLQTINANASGDLIITIPESLKGTPFDVIAYTQQKNNFHISGAARTVSN